MVDSNTIDDLIRKFKHSAHIAGEFCSFPTGKQIREFGLNDFLENSIKEGDDATAIALKALAFFCDTPDPQLQIFKFGVLAVGRFLSICLAKSDRQVSQQVLKDLVALLMANGTEDQLRRWIDSNFA